MKKLVTICAVVMMMFSAQAMAVNIDGTITAGEWDGAATYTIGNGGGTAYFKADTSFIYGAFDITGWDPTASGNMNGNLLGFGVWKVNGAAGSSAGVEFQQATDKASWGGDGPSGTMNGLDSAFRLSTVLQTSIPGSLQAMDSFATGHRVWEVMMPISTMTVSAGDTIWVVSGINYSGAQHWTPLDFISSGYTSYAPVAVVPEPCMFDLAGDLNDDCRVDFIDLKVFSEQWLLPPGLPSADIWPSGGDNTVNFQDFAVMAENWLIDCQASPSNPACVPK